MSRSFQQLSDPQQIVLSLLAIPGAILSVLGSSAIIYLACKRRKAKPWTPYNRLLIAMSVCDIAFSINVGTATFLRPKETSSRIWAFGNDATCNFIAFMNQATTAGIWYQGMLSIYFLLTARYGMKNERIAKRIEPLMHILALGYPIGTAILGATMGIYGERAGGTSCYLSNYENESVSDIEETEKMDKKDTKTLALIFYALPVVGVAMCLICTQMSIYLFVRRHTRTLSSQESEDTSSTDVSLGWSSSMPPSLEGSERGSLRSSSSEKKLSSSSEQKNKIKAPTSKLTSQSQRLRLVCSQAFLFVMSFLLCHSWNFIMGVLQNRGSTFDEEMMMMAKYYPVVVVQAILLPIQGLLNFLIYVRPRYLMLRLEFPREGRLWTVRRIFLGKKLPPTQIGETRFATHVACNVDRKHCQPNSDGDAPTGDTQTPRSGTSPARLPRSMISSVTASDDGDFDSQIDVLGEDERWQDASNDAQQSTPDLTSRSTTLEAISEISESVFELTPYQINGSHLSYSGALTIPTGPSEDRWKVADVPIRVPIRTSDEQEDDPPPEINSKVHPNPSIGPRAKQVSDVPLALPERFRSSPPSGIDEDDQDGPPPEINSKVHPNPSIGPRTKQVFDVPLAPPERFRSLPPSGIDEDE